MCSRIYVTTTIPYVNARPHVGFALELVQADAIARYNRLLGNDTRFQTGTDENAFKNVLAARARGLDTQQFVDGNAEAYRQLVAALRISADEFIRTTEDRHRCGVHAFWKRIRPEDIYRRRYGGLYCAGCEDFYLDKDLVDGRCPDHGTAPAEVEEENYFFRLSAYQARIEELLATEQVRIVPARRSREVLNFVRGGLRDFSISRDARRSGGWGIGVPGDGSQVIYVWVDALINYLSGLGFGRGDDWQKSWHGQVRKLHVIGKNVWKFHAVYWPALLLSAGLPLPNEIVVHGFLTLEGQKISKSLGNTIDPIACVEEFGPDAVRYYLLKGIPPFDDGDFSAERLRLLYNTDLANGLGNLVSRVTSLAERARFGRYDGPASPAAPEAYSQALQRHESDKALEALWQIVTRLNRDIDSARPWEAIKAGEDRMLKGRLTEWLGELHRVGYWLRPLLPDAGEKVLDAIASRPIRSCEPLFPRVK